MPAAELDHRPPDDAVTFTSAANPFVFDLGILEETNEHRFEQVERFFVIHALGCRQKWVRASSCRGRPRLGRAGRAAYEARALLVL